MNQHRSLQVSKQKAQGFWTGLWYHFIGKEPVNPARKNNIHCHQIEATSARQRKRRIDVTTGKNQGRFVFEIKEARRFVHPFAVINADWEEKGEIDEWLSCTAAAPSGGDDYLSEMEKPILGSSLCVGHNSFRQQALTNNKSACRHWFDRQRTVFLCVEMCERKKIKPLA